MAQRAERNKIIKSRAKIFVPVALLAIIVIIVLMVNQQTLSQRKTFTTEQEMSEFLSGSWSREYPSTNSYSLINITDGIIEYVDSGMPNLSKAEPIEYHPKRGYFTNGRTRYIVRKDGIQMNIQRLSHPTE